jgi:hypothetical protein
MSTSDFEDQCQDLDEAWECPTCLRPMPEDHDYECGTCEAKASEHLRVTTLCKLLRASQARESALIVKVNKLLRLIDAALTQYDLGGELEPETRHDLALAVDGRER